MVRVNYTVKVFIVQNLYANEILLIVAFLFVKILNAWHSAFLVIFRWFYRGGTARAAESQTWPGASTNIMDFRFCELQNAAVLSEL